MNLFRRGLSSASVIFVNTSIPRCCQIFRIKTSKAAFLLLKARNTFGSDRQEIVETST